MERTTALFPAVSLDARREEAVVLTLAGNARHALTARFGEDAPARLAACLGASELGGDFLLFSDAQELLRRARMGRLGWFVRPCPRWRHPAHRRHAALHSRLSAPLPGSGGRIAVVDCPLRKAELLRQGGFLRVLTVREAACLLIRSGLLPGMGGASACSDAYLQRLLFEARRLAGDPSAEPLVFSPAPGRPGVWEATGTLEGRPLRFARVRGRAAADALLEEAHHGGRAYDVIEVSGCAGGC